MLPVVPPPCSRESHLYLSLKSCCVLPPESSPQLPTFVPFRVIQNNIRGRRPPSFLYTVGVCGSLVETGLRSFFVLPFDLSRTANTPPHRGESKLSTLTSPSRLCCFSPGSLSPHIHSRECDSLYSTFDFHFPLLPLK